MAFVELHYFGKEDFFGGWSGKSWIKDEAGVLQLQYGAGAE